MLCIAAFIVFVILGIFSAYYRKLAAKAWICVLNRVTFRPCDVKIGDEIKGKIVGKLLLTHPHAARFVNRWIDWFAFAFVALSIWSLFAVTLSGLNLLVYDTCDPHAVESCSLGGEACSINSAQLTFTDAIAQNKLGQWAWDPFKTFGDTISRIPARFQYWEPAKYLGPTATYYNPYDVSKPTALEIIDPGCKFCKNLFENIKKAGFENKYNVSYLVYPIPGTEIGTYKFANSRLIASYLEAVKKVPLKSTSKVSPDWQLLELVFTSDGENNMSLQDQFDLQFEEESARKKLQELLVTIGYSEDEIREIEVLSHSPMVDIALTAQNKIVEEQIRTIKIPTIIFGGRRYDRVVDASTLQ